MDALEFKRDGHCKAQGSLSNLLASQSPLLLEESRRLFSPRGFPLGEVFLRLAAFIPSCSLVCDSNVQREKAVLQACGVGLRLFCWS